MILFFLFNIIRFVVVVVVVVGGGGGFFLVDASLLKRLKEI